MKIYIYEYVYIYIVMSIFPFEVNLKEIAKKIKIYIYIGNIFINVYNIFL